MSKKTRSLFVLFAFIAGSLVTLLASPLTPVRADSPPTAALFKITAVEGDGSPQGCVQNCPTVKTNTPTYAAQSVIGSAIASASKIDTFTVNTWDQTSQTNISFEGGCAIISGGLKCWGNNNYGQLGNESTTSSMQSVVTATDGGNPLTGVTDLSTNGKTTCIVASGALKCVGTGNFPGTYTKRTDTWYDTTPVISGVQQSGSRTEIHKLETFDLSNQVLSTVESASWVSDNQMSKKWITIPGFESGVAKVQVGSSMNGGPSSTPQICALTTSGTASCAVIVAGSPTNTNTPWSMAYECVLGQGFVTSTSNPCQTDTYKQRSENGNISTTSAATWTWVDAGATGAVDISMPSDSWGAQSLCIAGARTMCRTFSAGEFGTKIIIEGGDASEAVYVTSGFGPPGLCVYSSGTVSCGAGVSGPTGTTMATKVTPVAVMAKPLSIFFGQFSTMSKIYFVMPNGILAADGWIFSCSGCQTQNGNIVSPVTAFASSTSTDFTYAQSINGATDNANYIPMTVITGTRKARSSVALTVTTASGQALVGTSVRWTAPDAPGTLSSSASSTLATTEGGAARTTLVTGPVTFTLSGGTLANGASMQASSITVIVPESGVVSIPVPDPPAIVSRKISVVLPDGTAVPTATIALKNNYLTYAYQNSGSSTSTWSSRPRDTKGIIGQMSCAYCFVAPPRYATGADGSVTFPSFNPSIRSTAYDADVSYDDGELNQNVKKSFAGITETVSMPFMAKIAVAVADSNPATPETEVPTGAAGSVEVPTSLVDEDGVAISEFTSSVETVCDGMDKGGLISSTAKVETVCTDVSTTSLRDDVQDMSTGKVAAMRVRSFASCSSVMTTKTDAKGKSVFKLCPSVSTKYRIRGKGALASKPFCVVVGGKPCVSAASLNSTSGAQTIKISTVKRGKSITFASINKNAKISVSKGAKVVLVVAASSKKVCSVKGTTVKGLKAGKCSLSVKVTPKATAKVKKPKTKTTKVSVTVAK